MQRTCSKCEYFVRLDPRDESSKGHCHLLPPQPCTTTQMTRNGPIITTVFDTPVVTPSKWCSHFSLTDVGAEDGSEAEA